MEKQTAPKTSPAAPKPITFREGLQAVWEYFGKFSWVLLLLFSVGLIGYYVLFPSKNFFHSDTTDTLMWAVASYESGSLFNPDFNYACLLPFGTSLFMWALIPIFGVSMTTHVLGMLCFFLCFTGGLLFLLRQMHWSWGWASMAVTIELLMLSGSEKLREIFWGHTIYYSLGVLFIFVGLGLLFRYMDLQEKKVSAAKDAVKSLNIKLIITLVLLAVWFLLTATNQIIAMAIFALPVMGAWFCVHWFDHSQKLLCKKNLHALVLFGVMAVAAVLGYLITALLSKEIPADYEDSYSTLALTSTWVDNARKFPDHWFSLLGVETFNGMPIMSGEGISSLLMILAGAIILILPVVALCCYNKIEDKKLKILTLTFWIMTLLIMIAYICGMLSNANWRLSPIVAMAVLVSVAFLHWAVGQISMQRIITLMMIPVFAVSVLNAVEIIKMDPNAYKNNHVFKIGEELEALGLNYGYATFWRANAVTVASDSAVECRTVIIDQNGVWMSPYQGCDSWYEDQPGQDKYFLVMTDAEREAMLASGHEVAQMGYQEIQISNFTVWVFSENIFDPRPKQ